MRITRRAALLATALAFAPASYAMAAGDTLVLTLKDGDVTIKLRPDLAPKHVAQIEALVKEGAYNNVVFHRVIDGFMAQTGDVEFGNAEKGYNPARVGTGGSKKADIPAEFTTKASFERGTVGMARSSDPNSANSQFFINFAPAPSLNGQYTIVGEVTKGMEVIEQIKKGDPADNGSVSDPDRIIKAQIK